MVRTGWYCLRGHDEVGRIGLWLCRYSLCCGTPFIRSVPPQAGTKGIRAVPSRDSARWPDPPGRLTGLIHFSLPPARQRCFQEDGMQAHWLYLGVAIVAEVIATSALKATEGFPGWGRRCWWWWAIARRFIFVADLAHPAAGRGLCLVVGVGIALVTAFGWLYYRQALDAPTLCGLALIAAGIVLIQLRGGH